MAHQTNFIQVMLVEIRRQRLRRIFQAVHGVSPHDYLTTQRLLLAKQLLTDTTQPVTQVALASGFDSVRRFNAAFVERYRFNPTQLRKEGAAPRSETALRLAYRVANAGWEPIYRARLDTTERRIDWRMTARVHQQTGEDWPAVPMTYMLGPCHAG